MSRTLQCLEITTKRFTSSLSYKHQVGKAPLLPYTIGKLLEKTAKTYPDRQSTISVNDDKSITFVQLLQTADKLAAAFRKLGLKKGDRVGIWSPNTIEWEAAFFACQRNGLIATQLNPGSVANEVMYCINKVGMKCIVCPERTEKHNFYEVLEEIDGNVLDGKVSDKVPTIEKVVLISNNNLRNTINFMDMIEAVTDKEVKAVQEYQDKICMDSGAAIMFTSGSTGDPKATVLSHHNLVNNSHLCSSRLELDKKHHRLLLQVPFFHGFGTIAGLMGALHFGTTLVLPSLYYNSEANIRALEAEKCSVIYGTPTMLVDLINKQKEQKRNINPELVGTGGAPTNPKLIEDVYDILDVKNVVNFFGMTETSAVLFQSFLTDNVEKVANTLGHVADHTEVKVVDTDGNIVPCGTPGELCARGYTTMLGYYNDEENTNKMIGRDGWLKTGDKIVLYEDGYGKIIGRLKDLIIRGGEKIFPKEIEDFLSNHPNILECQVVGAPHERFGEEVCACVRLQPNTDLTMEEMQEYCKNKLSKCKVPSKLFIIKEFPKTTSGKIQKFRLVELIVNGEVRETKTKNITIL